MPARHREQFAEDELGEEIAPLERRREIEPAIDVTAGDRVAVRVLVAPDEPARIIGELVDRVEQRDELGKLRGVQRRPQAGQ